MRYFNKLICLFVTLFIVNSLQAQVTVGSAEAPAKAALLDIKQVKPQNAAVNNETAKTGGIIFPRVELVDMHNLKPFIDPTDADYEKQSLLHEGMIVYNLVTDPAKELYAGMYYWNGKQWERFNNSTTNFSLEVDERELIFPSGLTNEIITHKSFAAKWKPTSIGCDFSLVDIQNGGVRGLVIPSAISGGSQTISLKPDPLDPSEIIFNPFLEKSSIFHVAITDGLFTKNESVAIRQVHYALIAEGVENIVDLGSTHTWNVKSNTDWTLTHIAGDISIFETSPVTSGSSNIIGQSITLKISPLDSQEGKSATLRFSSPSGKFANQDIVISTRKEYPNSYIVKPGTILEFPIRKAYQVWKEQFNIDLPTTGLSVDLLWQDAPSLVQIPSLKTNNGANSIVKLQTSAKVGNACVVLKIGTETVWSWQIWITNYDPDAADITIPEGTSGKTAVPDGNVWSYFNTKTTTHFMDRNLGARTIISGTTLTDDMRGFTYQWGRKDGFDIGTNSKYDKNNLKIKFQTNVDSQNNVIPSAPEPNYLKYSIRNPLTFILANGTNSGDWYSETLGEENHHLWNNPNDTKGAFDPCPQGWRVPIMRPGTESPYYNLPEIRATIVDWSTQGAGVYGQVGYTTHTGTLATTQILCWAANDFANNSSPSLQISAQYFYLFRNNPRAFGFTVRCVKEIK